MERVEDLISGGYFLVRPIERPSWMSDLVPERISSVSGCLTEDGPQLYWAWEPGHFQTRTGEAVTWADRAGIARADLPAFRDWLINADRDDDIEFPSVMDSPDVIRRMFREFGLDGSPFSILGIAASSKQAAEFIAEEDAYRQATIAPTGIYETLSRWQRPAEGGERLGYEIVGECHSWLCNHLERDAASKFGVLPNREGFISTLEEAERLMPWVNDVDESGAEPVPWWPWLVSRYSVT